MVFVEQKEQEYIKPLQAKAKEMGYYFKYLKMENATTLNEERKSLV